MTLQLLRRSLTFNAPMTFNRNEEQPAEVSLDEALKLAVAMHRDNQLDGAETLYRRILALVPAQPEALHFLGLLARQRGRSREATELMRKAIAAAPDYVSAHLNLGNLLFEACEFEESQRHLRRALELEPEDPRALNNLANLACCTRRVDEGMALFERAIKAAPDFAMPYEGLARIYLGRKDVLTAYSFLCKAVILNPKQAQSKRFLGYALCALGRHDEAAALYREWIALEPDNPIPRHLLSTVCPEMRAARASDAYIRHTFDNFAQTFDVKLRGLEYRAPQLVFEALQISFELTQTMAVLDAGCGTGLCGSLLRPLIRHLEGVDLSPEMLNRAREKGDYDELIEGELTQFMSARPARYHAITCADTLCYFGELEPVLASAAIALRPGGRFVFTVEEASDEEAREPFCIRPSGRYAHTEGYLREVMAKADLRAAAITRSWLRMESGRQVAGLIAVAERPL